MVKITKYYFDSKIIFIFLINVNLILVFIFFTPPYFFQLLVFFLWEDCLNLYPKRSLIVVFRILLLVFLFLGANLRLFIYFFLNIYPFLALLLNFFSIALFRFIIRLNFLHFSFCFFLFLKVKKGIYYI